MGFDKEKVGGSTQTQAAQANNSATAGKKTLTQDMDAIRGDAADASGSGANAVLVLAAKRLYTAAADMQKLGQSAFEGHDAIGKNDFKDIIQQRLDEESDKARGALEDLKKLLDMTSAETHMGLSGLAQLDGAITAAYNASLGAKLGIDAKKVAALRPLVNDLYAHMGVNAQSAKREPASKESEAKLLDVAIKSNLDAAENHAKLVRAQIPAKFVEQLRDSVKAVGAHLQEAYVLMQDLPKTKQYKKPVTETLKEVGGMISDLQKQPGIERLNDYKPENVQRTMVNLRVILQTPWGKQ